jgi:Mrp family chromosome partitioning ATPase
MTRLDRAFIKAYSKTNAAPPTPHLNVPAASVAPSQAPTSEVPASDASARSPNGEQAAMESWIQRGPDVSRSDDDHALGLPHWTVSETSTFTTWDAVAEPICDVPHSPQAIDLLGSPLLAPAWNRSQPASETPTVARPSQAPEPSPHVRIDPPAIAAENGQQPAPLPVSPAPFNADQAPQTESWRAAFEVDNLLWPEVNYSLAAACRSQWDSLMRELVAASREGQKVVLVSSYARGEGRTSLVLCLAQLLSQKQKRVAVVDADFQRPQIARQLKLLPACGWDEVVRDKQPLTEAWIESVSDGVTLLPLDKQADATGLAGNTRLKQVFEALRSTHDIVLIDAGAVSDSNDRENLALLAGTAQIDLAVLVRDVRSTSWDTLHDSQKCLDAIGIARWDVVENFAD